MRRLARYAVALAIIGTAAFWWLTRPGGVPPDRIAALAPDLTVGEQVFFAGGCASCHSAPGTEGEARLVLSGGRAFVTPFGTFYAPNISSDPDHGIGRWSALDLANAMRYGVSPDGAHYYPAFPYTSYARATLGDIVSLRAYLDTLPASDAARHPHEVRFPFGVRRLLGGWKLLFLRSDWVVTGPLTPAESRGRYLAEALGHCGECHTRRNPLGGLRPGRWLGGAPNPNGRGTIPNITPGRLTWTESDIAEYLSSGFTPEFDTAGGHMAEVIENTSHLPPEDRAALAAYLKRVPPLP